MIMKDPDNPMTCRFLYQVKNSLAPQAGGVGFTLQATENPFHWGQPTIVSAEEMFGTGRDHGEHEENPCPNSGSLYRTHSATASNRAMSCQQSPNPGHFPECHV